MRLLEARRFRRATVCIGLISVLAEPPLLAQIRLPLSPTAPQQLEAPRDSGPPAASPSDSGLAAAIRRVARDQKQIYSAPFQRRNLQWDGIFLVVTAGLIAADRHVAGAIPHGSVNVSQHISDVGVYSAIGTTGVLLVSGILKGNERAREAGTLGFEAFANTLAVSAVAQLVAGRERPLEGAGHGRFWVNNSLASSFPSMHSSLTWSIANVLGHEYPRPWVRVLAYGTASTVSVTRVTGSKHFPADVMAGAVLGFTIGQYVFRAHSRFFHRRGDQVSGQGDLAAGEIRLSSRP